jgi:hypothetical protein
VHGHDDNADRFDSMQDSGVRLEYLAAYRSGIFDGSAAEAQDYDKHSKVLFFTSAEETAVKALDLNPLADSSDIPDPVVLTVPEGFTPQSVTVHKGLVAVALSRVRATELLLLPVPFALVCVIEFAMPCCHAHCADIQLQLSVFSLATLALAYLLPVLKHSPAAEPATV